MRSAGPNPLVYEINTRCWLRELSDRLRIPVGLGEVPDEEIRRLHTLGFTHVWLMGVWKVGPRSRAHGLEHFKSHPGGLHCAEGDIHGSTFAIAGYVVDENIGGEDGLARFREQLRGHDLKLLLDFIPNHVGLDHPWLAEEPALFVHNSKRFSGSFVQHIGAAKVFIAHGKDPYFPPWTDTAQLDYRNPDTRLRMQRELLSVAARCDGVRCDMAMLLLTDVFTRNWAGFPSAFPPLESEFWEGTIQAVRKAHPGFLFLAEAYWDLEARLQQLGFDYTYFKTFYDDVMARRFGKLQEFLRRPRELLAHGAFFLENHDEPRVSQCLRWPEHPPAALLLASMPGLRLLHEGQLEGLETRVSVHFSRRPAEKPHPEVARFYDYILSVLQNTSIGKGQWMLLDPVPLDSRATLPQGLFIIQWQSESNSFEIVVVNLSGESIDCRVRPPAATPQDAWVWRSVFSAAPGLSAFPQLKNGELSLFIQPYHSQILTWRSQS
jgi:hypothetical protein